MVALPRLIAGAVLLFLGCFVLPDSGRWEEETFEGVSRDDVFAIAVVQLDRDFAIARASLADGVVETDWEDDAVSPTTRYLQRERVVARIEAVPEGVKLRLRVETEVRPHTGILDPDLAPRVEWSPGPDDERRAAILMQRIRSSLEVPGPSERFSAPVTGVGRGR